MLNWKNSTTVTPVGNLHYRMWRPLVVKQKIEPRAYDLELPARWTIYLVFNIGRLEVYHPDPIGRPQSNIQAPDNVDSDLS